MKLFVNIALALTLIGIFATGANSATINVPADQPTIQAALVFASNGDMILVAPGTYYEHDLRLNTGELNTGVMLKSTDGASVTIIDAQHLGKCIYADNTSVGTSVDGFTLINGAGIEPDPHGGIIYAVDGALAIANCVISGGTAALSGGGIYAVTSTITITSCTISGSYSASGAGGAYFERCTDVFVDNCVVYNNNGYEGGMVFNVTTGRISNSEFYRNQGLFGGGISSDKGDVDIVGNLIHDNVATYSGGGIYCGYYGVRNITNNTIVGNSAPNGSGVFCAVDAKPTMSNCIIALNTGSSGIGCQYGTSIPVTTCSDIFGNSGGDGLCGTDGGNNISTDPMFCNQAGGDYHLNAGSPAAIAQCGLMGAMNVGCGVTPVRPTTWGSIKAMYR